MTFLLYFEQVLSDFIILGVNVTLQGVASTYVTRLARRVLPPGELLCICVALQTPPTVTSLVLLHCVGGPVIIRQLKAVYLPPRLTSECICTAYMQDVSDSEWGLWHEVMVDGFYMWLIGQVVLGQLIICFGKQVLHFCLWLRLRQDIV